MKYMYRVTREDTYSKYYHQPLVREVNSRSMTALVASSKEYPRYKIVKIERAPIGEFEDVTQEMLGEKDPDQDVCDYLDGKV